MTFSYLSNEYIQDGREKSTCSSSIAAPGKLEVNGDSSLRECLEFFREVLN